MTDLTLKMACWETDRTRALLDGRVKPDGIALDIERLRPRQMFARMLENQEFDVSELSLASLCGLIGRGDRSFIGIPVIMSKFFRHSCIYVRKGAGIAKPEDLRGKRVGTTQFSATAVVFMKGMLQHEYGVRQSEMEWFIGGLTRPTERPLIALNAPSDVRISFLPDGDTLERMLAEDRLDALLSIYIPPSFLAGSAHITRLFPDYRAVERDYFNRTGIFPIMHVLAMRRSLHEAHPWIAQNLYTAFERSKNIALNVEDLYDTDSLKIGLPWLLDYVEETRRVFGDDWWAYGIAPNRPALEAVGRYVHEQGLSPRTVIPEEVFVPCL
ncbi:ABC transporter substrate-binding protein [Roseiarcaceae bacterium H3SJ34-1]|uniref:ABC transporter substrate-binding protein n=1 Tax=Terripilifer ovatus TaxID=3032367 RepID=UPI003AB959E4|nr:ABC transporter substrate-binding protein [Roseiarcaceae bacterium H3SJ34-1]